MPILSAGLLGCYRCGYVWRTARPRSPRVCSRCKSRFWEVPVLRPVPSGTGQGISEVLLPHRERILAAARIHHFAHVRVFGSVRRSQATRRSDVDLLVSREGASLLDRAALTEDLEQLLHRRVDVVPEEGLHWLARPQILFEAVPL